MCKNLYLYKIIILGGKEVALKDKEETVDKLIDYLRNNNIYICSYTMRKYMNLFLNGKLDLTKKHEENLELMNLSDDESNKTDNDTKIEEKSIVNEQKTQMKQYREMLRKVMEDRKKTRAKSKSQK